MKKTILLILAALMTQNCSKSNSAPGSSVAASTLPQGVSVLTLSPAASSLAPGETLQINASAGVPPYKYKVIGCDSMISVTGLFTANGDSSQCQVSVSDAANESATGFVTINSIAQILKLSPSTADLTAGVHLQFTASGGQSPYTYAVSGCDSTVSVSGAFLASSDASTCLVTVTDSNGVHAVASVTVSLAPKPLVINSPPFLLQFKQSAQLNVSGGIAPYQYSVAGCDSTISPSGLFIAASDTSSCTIVVTDAGSDSTSAIVQVLTNAVPSVQVPHELAFGQSGAVSVSGGTAPYQLSISGCNSSLSGTGQLTAAGDLSTCRVTAIDANGKLSSANTSIVAPISIQFPQASAPTLEAGQAVLLSISGGTPPYTISIAKGLGVISNFYFIAPAGPPFSASSGQTAIVVTDAYQLSTSITLRWEWFVTSF